MIYFLVYLSPFLILISLTFINHISYSRCENFNIMFGSKKFKEKYKRKKIKKKKKKKKKKNKNKK